MKAARGNDIGLEPGTVRLAPYTAAWKRLFEAERARLLQALGNEVLDIQHVGSTAIPGVDAKPILDIGIAVENFQAARVCIKPLEGLGYIYRGENGIPRRHYLVKGDPRAYHVHMVEATSREWGTLIGFRDYLTHHPAAVTQYIALKRSLAQQFPHDRQAYTDGKADFIARILELAGTNP